MKISVELWINLYLCCDDTYYISLYYVILFSHIMAIKDNEKLLSIWQDNRRLNIGGFEGKPRCSIIPEGNSCE